MSEDIENNITQSLISKDGEIYSYKIKILSVIFFIVLIIGILLYYCGHIYNKSNISSYGVLLLYIDVLISFILGCYLRYMCRI